MSSSGFVARKRATAAAAKRAAAVPMGEMLVEWNRSGGGNNSVPLRRSEYFGRLSGSKTAVLSHYHLMHIVYQIAGALGGAPTEIWQAQFFSRRKRNYLTEELAKVGLA